MAGSRVRGTFGAGGADRDCTGDGGTRPDIDSPAKTSPAVNEMSGDKRKVRAGRAALPVNGINESGTILRRRNRFARARPVPSSGR
jgi:hypothetical protein